MKAETRGGARKNAGRHGLEGGRSRIPVRMLAKDHARLFDAVGDGVMVEWVRDAAMRDFAVKPGSTGYRHGLPRKTAYVTLPGSLRLILEERVLAKGCKSLAAYLRLAILARLDAGT